MLSFRSKLKLGKLIQSVGQCEWTLEELRQKLGQFQNYELYTVFKRIDHDKKGHIDSIDLRQFMNENDQLVNLDESEVIIREISDCQDRLLNCNDFSRFMHPRQNQTLKNIISNRQPYVLVRPNRLDFDIEWTLAKLFSQILRNHQNIQNQVLELMECYDYSERVIFDTIDIEGSSVINVNNLDRFMNSIDIYINDQQFDSYFIKVDVNKNGVIGFREFIQILAIKQYHSTITNNDYDNHDTISNSRLYSSQRINRSNINQTRSPVNMTRSNMNIARSPVNMSRSNMNMNRSPTNLRNTLSPGRINPSATRLTNNMGVSRLNNNNNPSDSRLDNNDMSVSRYQRNDNDLNSQYDQYTRTQNNKQLSRRISPTSMNNTMNNTYLSENSMKQPSASRLYSPNRSIIKPTNQQSQRSTIRSPHNRKPKSPLKQHEEFQLFKAIQQQLQIEKQLEDQRKNLSLKNDFNFLDGFRQIDIQGKGYLSRLDFENVLYDMGINCTRDEIQLVFKRYDRDNDGLLKYSDFCRIVTPVSIQHQDIMKSKQPYYDQTKTMSFESKQSLKRLIHLLIDGESQSEKLRQRIQLRQDFNIIDAFDALDKNDNGFITPNEFGRILQNYGVYVSSKDLQTLIKRYDQNNDGRVSYSEFCNEIMPRSPTKI